MVKYIGLLDVVLAIMYLFFIYIVAKVYQNKKIKTDSKYRFLIIGLTTKIVGGIAFALIYTYYYGGGDTFVYYQGAEVLFDAFTQSPLTFIKIMMLDAGEITPDTSIITDRIYFFNHGESFFLIKIAAVLNILAFNSYIVTTILFSITSFIGAWYMYKGFLFFTPHLHKYIGYAVFYIPSVIFWGGGVMKDTIALASLGIIFYLTVKLVAKFRIYYLPVLFIFGYVILALKAYILIAFAVSALMYFYWEKSEKVKNVFLKIIIAPVLFLFIIGAGVLTIPTIMNNTQKYKIDDIETRVEGFQSWHSYLAENRESSGYSLASIELTPMGALKKFPAAVNVALFRPYLWEARNMVNGIAAIESLFFLLITLYVIFSKFSKFFKTSYLKFYLLFSVVLAFIVGFTSYNFGALVRFKIPFMSFYLVVFIIVLYDDKFKNQKQVN